MLSSDKFVLKYFQTIPKYYLLDTDSNVIICNYGMGTGKTATAIYAVTYYYQKIKQNCEIMNNIIESKLPQITRGIFERNGAYYNQDLSENMKTTFRNIINIDLRKYLKFIYCPTLIIWGENDTSTPLKDGILMNKRRNNSGLIVLKKGTHFVYLEYPFYILKIILEFF